MNVIRVALPGYNAFTDQNPDHFALFSDSDNVLIKEFARGSVSVNASANTDIMHNLSYFPFACAWYNFPDLDVNEWHWLCGVGRNSIEIAIKTDRVNLRNASIFTCIFRHYIFYDKFSS